MKITHDNKPQHLSKTLLLSLFIINYSFLIMNCESPVVDNANAGSFTVAAPVANPPAGKYLSAPQVTLSTTTEGALIYYTLDGSDPATSATSAKWTTPVPVYITVDEDKTLKALAVLNGKTSEPLEALYSKQTKLDAPVANPPGGGYAPGNQSVTLTTTLESAAIYYTTDGSDPASSGTRQVYNNPVPITLSFESASKTIRAMAKAEDYEASDTVTETYSVDSFQFTVRVKDDADGLDFIVPTSQPRNTEPYDTNGYDYNWIINWGDGTTDPASGTGNPSARKYYDGYSEDITHTYTTAGDYRITIMPAAAPSGNAGWFEAFGSGLSGQGDSSLANRGKLISLDSPLSYSAKKGYSETPLAENAVGDFYCYFMFKGCTNLESIAGFTLPQNITSAGDYFCANMFTPNNRRALTNATGFNLPQKLTSVGDNFCISMFVGNLEFTMPEGFNIPPGITSIGNGFCESMFAYCTKLQMAEGFNLPQGIEGEVGDHFCYQMFVMFDGGVITMAEGFNLPPGITSVGESFCYAMFENCYALEMAEGFNLPPGITSAGKAFCFDMFTNCKNSSTKFLAESFQLPQNITSAGERFCSDMFWRCTSADIDINQVLGNITVFKDATDNNATNSDYYRMFHSCSNATGTFSDAPLSNTTPAKKIGTFYGCTKLDDYGYMSNKWREL